MPGEHEVKVVVDRRSRLEATSRHGPWTRSVPELVAAHPARRAGDLADLLGRDATSFDVGPRRLEEIGLTESLGTGHGS